MNRLSYRSAATLGIVCLGVRAFFAAYIDSPELLGAGWLGVLAGGAAGANLLGVISPAAATLVFAAVMFAAGVRMIV